MSGGSASNHHVRNCRQTSKIAATLHSRASAGQHTHLGRFGAKCVVESSRPLPRQLWCGRSNHLRNTAVGGSDGRFGAQLDARSDSVLHLSLVVWRIGNTNALIGLGRESHAATPHGIESCPRWSHSNSDRDVLGHAGAVRSHNRSRLQLQLPAREARCLAPRRHTPRR